MKFVWRHTLLLMWMAFAAAALASQNTPALVGPNAVNRAGTLYTDESSIPKQAREKIQRLTGPSDASTQALQSGFVKLKRLCEFGTSTQSNTEYDPPLIAARTRNELSVLTRSLEKVTNDFRQTSRISTLASCKFIPALLLLSGACQGFQEDMQRVQEAEQAAKRLVAQAQTRLDLYDQYLELEHQGCTRPGFARKLWASEEANLWPLLLEAPSVFKLSLHPQPAN